MLEERLLAAVALTHCCTALHWKQQCLNWCKYSPQVPFHIHVIDVSYVTFPKDWANLKTILQISSFRFSADNS